MLNWRNKYSTRISLVILTGYSFLTLISVFHHHKFEVKYTQTFQKQNDSSYESKTYQSGSGIECIIIHNYVSLHSTLLVSAFKLQIFKSQNHKIISFNLSHSVLTDYQRINQLRAPPIFTWFYKSSGNNSLISSKHGFVTKYKSVL